MDRNEVIAAAARMIAAGAYDEALEEYQEILEVDPDDVRILQKMGELFMKKNEIARAAEYFAKGAETYASGGFFSKAVALYKQIIKLDPSLIHVNLKLAELHEQLYLSREAMAYFQAAASQYAEAGDTDASLAALTRRDTLKKSVELDRERTPPRVEPIGEVPDEHAPARALAEGHLSRGNPQRAIAELQVCFEADPRHVDTLRLLALAFRGLGQISRAVFIYQELARVYDEKGRRREAEQVWKQVEQLELPPPAAPAPERAAHPPVPQEADAAPTEPASVQLCINLVCGVKVVKSNGFTSVAPQRSGRGAAGASLGALLTRKGLIHPAELKRANEAQVPGESLQTSLVRTGAITERGLIDFLAKHYGVPGIDLDDFDIEPEVRALIPQHLWVARCVFAVNRAGPSLIVAMRDPSDLETVDDLRFLTGLSIEPVVSSELSIRRTIERYGRAPRVFLN